MAEARKQEGDEAVETTGKEWGGTSKESVLVSDAGRIIARRWKWSAKVRFIFLEDIFSKNNLDNFSSRYIIVPSRKQKQ